MTTLALISPPTAPTIEGPPLGLGVLASGSGTNFEAIANAIEVGRLNARIECVIYNRVGAGVADKAASRGIPTVFLDHKEFASRADFDAQVVQALHTHQAEWVIMAGWMRVVTNVLLSAFADHVLNIHPSLLPAFPGLRAVEQALEQGVRVSGCTVHIVGLEVDQGPIIAQAAVPVLEGDTAASLHARIQREEHRLYPMGIALAAMRPDATSP